MVTASAMYTLESAFEKWNGYCICLLAWTCIYPNHYYSLSYRRWPFSSEYSLFINDWDWFWPRYSFDIYLSFISFYPQTFSFPFVDFGFNPIFMTSWHSRLYFDSVFDWGSNFINWLIIGWKSRLLGLYMMWTIYWDSYYCLLYHFLFLYLKFVHVTLLEEYFVDSCCCFRCLPSSRRSILSGSSCFACWRGCSFETLSYSLNCCLLVCWPGRLLGLRWNFVLVQIWQAFCSLWRLCRFGSSFGLPRKPNSTSGYSSKSLTKASRAPTFSRCYWLNEYFSCRYQVTISANWYSRA